MADARTLDLVTAELRVLIDGLSSVRYRLVLRGTVATNDRVSLQTALDHVCADNTGEGLLLPPRDLWPLGVKVHSGLVLLPIEVTLERSRDRSTFCYWDQDTYARIHSFREVHTADLAQHPPPGPLEGTSAPAVRGAHPCQPMDATVVGCAPGRACPWRRNR